MSDTPRTESYVLNPHPECVPAEFARDLERDLIYEIAGRKHYLWKIAELAKENARLQMELDASCNAEELRQVRAENARLQRVAQLARDAVESGSIDECYLSLLGDALSGLPIKLPNVV